jgi:acyl dehydratase
MIISFFFEDYHIGEMFVTKVRIVAKTDVVNFAALSQDNNQIRTDFEYTMKTIYGKRITYELVGLAIYSGLDSSLTKQSILGFFELRWQFKLPINIHDSVYNF